MFQYTAFNHTMETQNHCDLMLVDYECERERGRGPSEVRPGRAGILHVLALARDALRKYPLIIQVLLHERPFNIAQSRVAERCPYANFVI